MSKWTDALNVQNQIPEGLKASKSECVYSTDLGGTFCE